MRSLFFLLIRVVVAELIDAADQHIGSLTLTGFVFILVFIVCPK